MTARGGVWHCEYLMIATVPAIANAISDALGIRFNDLPLSEEVIEAK